MSRNRLLAATAVCFAVFLTVGSSESEARHWSVSARYDSGFFHDYHNYGALYSHRPYSYYHSYYGARTYRGVSPAGYYGGWSYYAPYAYTPRYSTYSSASFYRNYPVATQQVGYGSTAPASSSCSSCESAGSPCNSCQSAGTCAPTCCSTTVAYSPGCFSCGTRRGLLGPLCPFRRASCNYGTCGSFGYSSGGCGW